ncbi:MAG: heme NO-binding domain-containing protein [Gammaproteobacteria bacterium]|nr:heme NO-binding domain-containing protein [Gammaproteobacteria bacterium]MCP5136491.1 heme NO-binding domain-containing protein [Gammaproteobacteria bacterium]
MKGVVFTEFLEMVEEVFSPEIADRIITESSLESGGIYTAVGTYPHDEIVAMVGHLAEITGVDTEALIKAFGNHLFGRFVALYPGFFEGVSGTFEFLSSIEEHVHKEVRKLYPDAELPTFHCSYPDANTMIMRYESSRPFASLAEGLIEGGIAHWGEPIKINREAASNDMGHAVFTLTRQA